MRHARPSAPKRPPVGRLLASSAVLALGLMLGGCLTTGAPEHTAAVSPPPKPAEPAPAPAVQREHQRILAAYGGAYEDARLERLLTKVVERLVAAPERPDQRFRITVLNSAAINAFAWPTGQLYVTRGLLALANDSSEGASVLAHEMAHVVAQHAEIRENRARTVALVNRVWDTLGSD